jgi:hypothetical protein
VAYDAGTAHLQVIPSFRDWEREVAKELNRLGRQLSGAFDQNFTGKLGDDLKRVAEGDLPKMVKAVQDANRQAARSTDESNQEQARSYGNLYNGLAEMRRRRAEDDIKAFDRERRGAQQVADDRLAVARKEIDARSRAAEQARNREFEAERRAAQQISEARLQQARKEVADRERELNASRERQIKADEDAFRRSTAGRTQAGVTAAGESIQKIKVTADTSEADRQLQVIRAELVALSDKRVGVHISVNDFITEVERQFAQLQVLAHDEHVDINVRTDAARAATELGGILVLLNRIDGDKAEVKVDADTGAAVLGLAALEVSLGRLGLQIALAASLGSGLVPVFAGAAAAVGAVGTAAAAVGAGLGVMVLGFSGIGTAVKAMQQLDLATAKTAKSLGAARTALANATDGVRSAEAGLANTRASNADSAIRAEQAVQDAVRGVGQAQRDVGRAAQEVARARQDAARQVADAEQRVADTERALSAAVRDVAQARVDAARSVRDAEDRVAEAETQHQRAIIDVQRAQEDLNQAYIDARRDLEDLNSSIKGNSLDQRQAILDIADAQKQLNLLRANPRATAAEIEQAGIRLEREQLGLEDLKRREQELGAERAKADKQGVEGSARVQSAQQALAAAQQRVADTQKAQQRAAQDLEQARADAVRKIADAQQKVADAQRANTRAEQDLTRARVDAAQKVADAQQRLAAAQQGVADAQRRVADAERAQEQQRRQAAFALAQATQAVVQAQRQAAQASLAMGAAGGEALSNLNDAMSQLSPTAQRFARFIFGLKDEFLQLRAAASDGMLTGLQQAIELLLPYLPAVRDFIAQVSAKIGDLFLQSANLLKDPIFVQFFEYMRVNTVPMLQNLFTIASNVAKGLLGLFLGFTPLTNDVTGALVNISQKFADWAATLNSNTGFKAFVQYMKDSGPQLGQLLQGLGQFTLRFVEAAAPIGRVVLQAFIGLVNLLNKIPINVLTALIGAIGGVSLALSILSGITTIAALGLAPLLVALGVGLVIAAVVAVASIKPLRDWFIKVFKDIAAAGLWLWNVVLKPTFTAIGSIIQWLWTNFLYPLVQIWKTEFQIIGQYLSFVWTNFIRPIVVLIGAIFRNFLAPIIVWLWGAIIKPTFAVIGVAFKILGAVVQVAAGLFQIQIKIMAAIFRWLWTNAISPVWNGFVKPALMALGAFLGKYVIPPFKRSLEAIANMWATLAGFFKQPIQFVVNTILNGGLLGAYNRIAKFFNVKPDDVHIDLPKNWNAAPPRLKLATGGIMPGYTPGRDVHQFVSPTGGILELSGGEPVLRPEAGRVLGRDWVDGINFAARRGGTGGVRDFLGAGGAGRAHRHARGGFVQSFAGGGFFDKVGDFFAKAKDKAKSIIGGIKDFVTNPSGVLRKLAEGLLKQLPNNRVANIARNIPIKVMDWAIDKVKDLFNVPIGGSVGGIKANASPGFPPWPSSPGASRGDSGVWRNIVALIKSTGPMSGSFGNGYRPGDPLWHGSGRAVDWMGFNQDRLAQFLIRHRPLELIHRSKSRDYAFTRGVNKGSFNESLMNAHRNHVHIAMKLGGLLPKLHSVAMKLGGLLGFGGGGGSVVKGGDGASLQPLSFDSGGWLYDTRNQPGQTVQVFHGRREPDAVLSNQQWRTMATLAGRGTGDTGPRTVNNFQFRDSTLTMDRFQAMERRRDAIERIGRPG